MSDRRSPALQETFSELIQLHRGIVFKVANTYARGTDEREDLAQEIAAQAWRSFLSYDPARPFSTWLYRVALNVGISHLRGATIRSAHHVPLEDSLHGSVADHRAGEDDGDARVRALYAFIEQLDPLHRALLILYLDEHSHADMASILGITPSNVATKISRLKQRIRKEMKG